MGRIGRGSASMMKQSFALLRRDKELMVLPLLSGVAIAIVGVVLLRHRVAQGGRRCRAARSTAGVVTAFVLYVITYTVAFFFQAALVAGASGELRG
ncbi:MAG: hypothetical protein R3F05_09700 [Planctomycetota bacterium]